MENVNTINTSSALPKDATAKLIEAAGKRKDYDPILDDPISDEEKKSDKSNSGESDDEEESSEEEVQIQFPKENAAELMTFLHREMTNLQNMEDSQKRKYALLRFYEIFVLAKTRATKKVYQEVLPQIQKPMFKRLADPV
jgi:hypothetical protein